MGLFVMFCIRCFCGYEGVFLIVVMVGIGGRCWVLVLLVSVYWLLGCSDCS